MQSGKVNFRKLLLFAVLLATLVFVSVGCASAATHYVYPGESIQAAVDAAASGDTIIVRDGIYTENINVNRRLTIRSENGATSTIVQAANPNDHVFEVTSDYVNLSGFTVRGTIESQKAGIRLYYANYCGIFNNNVVNTYHGLQSWCSSNNMIANNVVSNNRIYGIYMTHSGNNTLRNNQFQNNGILIHGSGTTPSHFNTHTIEDNTVNGKPIYYYKNENGIKVPEDAGEVILASCNGMIVKNINASLASVGILLAYTTNSEISENIVSNNTWGIYLDKSNYNTLENNNINSNNYYGITVSGHSSYNIITSNNIASNNRYGIYMYYSSDNFIYLNNFVENIKNAHSVQSTSTWSSSEERAYTYEGSTYTNYLGNYWSDYVFAGSDADGDGIGDTPYPIDSDNDNYPLMLPWENYILLVDITPPASISNLQNVTGKTWINWTWTNPADADFNYTMVYLNGTWRTNTSSPFFNVTGLFPDTYYEIATHTVDQVGNINTIWVNQTAKTLSSPVIWSEDIRLTTNSAGSWGPSIALDSNNNVHITWEDTRDGNKEIYYTELDNTGNTLIDDTRLTTNNSYSSYPTIAVDSSNNVHIAWIDYRDGNWEVYYTKVDDNGNILVDDTRLTTDPAMSRCPDIALDSNNNVHIIWYDDRNGDEEIYYTKLDNNGNTLIDDTRTYSPHSWGLSINVDSSNNLHIAWHNHIEQAVYYTKLDNNGNTLVDDTRLTTSHSATYSESTVGSDGNVHITWHDWRDGNDEIYYTKLDNNGNTLINDTRLTTDSAESWAPSIASDSNNNLHITWHDERDGNFEIYYTKLDNNGNTLVDDMRLTVNSEWSARPNIAIDLSNNIHITWYDERDGNAEIYYKTTSVDTTENQPPTAAFTYSSENPLVNEEITFDASSSFDTDGEIVSYEWDFGDGASGTGEVAYHSYSSAGDYTVTLTVTDDEGGTDTETEIVTVVKPDLWITDIKPIQTIQDIPLIKDKATMVRVFVDFAPNDIKELSNVTVELEFGGRKYKETGNLIRYDGKLYMVPDDRLDRFKDYINTHNEKKIKWEVFQYGLQAFNFKDVGSPSNVGSININAAVDPDNKIDETDETNNEKVINYKVKSVSDGEYKILFQRLSVNGKPEDFSKVAIDDIFTKFAVEHYKYLLATYPITPKNTMPQFEFKIKKGSTRVLWRDILSCPQDFDRVVYIVPGDFMEVEGFSNLANKCSVLVREDQDGSTTAHEIGHTYEYCDEYEVGGEWGWIPINSECGFDWDQDAYPHGYVGGDGWDVIGSTSIGPKISLERDNPENTLFNYFSFMSDGSAQCWVPAADSPCNSYNKLLNEFVSGGSDPKVILVKGVINESCCSLEPFYTFDGIPDNLTPGNYSIECISATGDTLSNISFDSFHFVDVITGEVVAPFAFRILYIDGTSKIVLKRNGETCAEILKTENMPTVTINSVNDLGNGRYEVVWNATDLDGDILSYSIYYSSNGENWLPLVLDSSEVSTNFIFDTFDLPGSSSSVIKIVLTDGINTAEVISDPFSVSNKPPFAFISTPINGSEFIDGIEIEFKGDLFDPEGDLNYSYWNSDIDGFLGDGNTISSNLSLGKHEITFTAVDSDGLSGTDSIDIIVTTEIEPDLTVKDITFNPESVEVHESVVVTAEISNIIVDAFCEVAFYDGNPDSGGVLIANTTILVNANLLTYVPITHNFTTAGVHDIYVTISDSDPEESDISNNKAFKYITVAENEPPIASFTYSPENPVVGGEITFDASASTDSDGAIVSYEWDFGDGSIATGLNTTHIYFDKGNYTVTFIAIDDAGGIGEDTAIVTVKSIPTNVIIKPETLNLKSKGEFTAFITLPESYDIADINISTVVCEGASAVKGTVADDNKYIAKFDKENLRADLPTGDAVTLTVIGKVFYNGGYADFEGSDTIKVIDKGKDK